MDKPRFLIVEDQKNIRKFIASLLKPFKAMIVEAVDGKDGHDILSADQEFDLIITDVDMPRMDGIKFCEWLKNEESTKSIPVIIVSSFDSDADVDRGFEVGASAYVSKGEAKEFLYETVESILSSSSFRKERSILVVDDSALVRQVVENFLLKAGFKVTTVENGRMALELLQKNDFDLILSDIVMPEIDGYALCEKVKKDPRLAFIPFVVMSVHSERRHMKKIIQRGAAAYIVKPFKLEELLILIERILSDQFLLLLKEKEKLALERDLILASITSLVKALEARDSYTKGHSDSVAKIVVEMAALHGTSEEEIERLNMAALLHDFGKIGVRDAILFKRDKLSAEEYDEVKQHPVIACNILQSIPSLADVVEVIRHHHERYDGKGYPDGKKGEEIPLWARMMAVADTFDAMSSDRPYRKGIEVDEIFKTLKSARGTQLCPYCVDLFFKLTLVKGFPVKHPRGIS